LVYIYLTLSHVASLRYYSFGRPEASIERRDGERVPAVLLSGNHASIRA